MTNIELTFNENNKGTYDFKVAQNGRLFFKKEYVASETSETGLTQAQVFSGYTNYLQDLVNEKLAKDHNFKWNTFDEFKKFAGAKTQHMFWAVKDEYIDYPKAE